MESKGYVIAAHQIQVSPIEVSGLIKELAIEEGKRFKKGDVLAVLDKTSFEADAADAKASLASAEAKLLKKADLEGRSKSPISLMPKGLLDKLSRDEILDLIAYIAARGSKSSPLFQEGHHHDH